MSAFSCFYRKSLLHPHTHTRHNYFNNFHSLIVNNHYKRNPQNQSDSWVVWPNSPHSQVVIPRASLRPEVMLRTLRREDEALAPQLLTGTVQELPLLVNIGREATRVWIHSCYRRVEKQVAKVCCSMFFDERFISPIGLRTRKLVARKCVSEFSEEKTKKGAKKFAVTTAQA